MITLSCCVCACVCVRVCLVCLCAPSLCYQWAAVIDPPGLLCLFNFIIHKRHKLFTFTPDSYTTLLNNDLLLFRKTQTGEYHDGVSFLFFFRVEITPESRTLNPPPHLYIWITICTKPPVGLLDLEGRLCCVFFIIIIIYL